MPNANQEDNHGAFGGRLIHKWKDVHHRCRQPAELGARVLLTDGDDRAVRLLRANVAANASSAAVARLAYGDAVPPGPTSPYARCHEGSVGMQSPV